MSGWGMPAAPANGKQNDMASIARIGVLIGWFYLLIHGRCKATVVDWQLIMTVAAAPNLLPM
ncbi:hypothetical protein GCM10027614_70710 [Micromonospora vulcania]